MVRLSFNTRQNGPYSALSRFWDSSRCKLPPLPQTLSNKGNRSSCCSHPEMSPAAQGRNVTRGAAGARLCSHSKIAQHFRRSNNGTSGRCPNRCLHLLPHPANAAPDYVHFYRNFMRAPLVIMKVFLKTFHQGSNFFHGGKDARSLVHQV